MAIYSPITLGRGPRTVVCLPGWYGSADNWGPWRTYLDTEEFRWVFFDYRGYGIRMGETGSFTVTVEVRERGEDLPVYQNIHLFF